MAPIFYLAQALFSMSMAMANEAQVLFLQVYECKIMYSLVPGFGGLSVDEPAKKTQQEKWSDDEEKANYVGPGNTKGGSISVPLISCLTGLKSAV